MLEQVSIRELYYYKLILIIRIGTGRAILQLSPNSIQLNKSNQIGCTSIKVVSRNCYNVCSTSDVADSYLYPTLEISVDNSSAHNVHIQQRYSVVEVRQLCESCAAVDAILGTSVVTSILLVTLILCCIPLLILLIFTCKKKSRQVSKS